MRDTENGSRLNDMIISRHEIIKETYQEIKNGEIRAERLDDIYGFLIQLCLQKTIAHYSVGDSKEIIKASLLEAVPAFEDGFVFDKGYGDYDTMIWMIAIGILCDISAEDFKRITNVIKRDGANDALLSFLISSKQQDWASSTASVIQPDPYAKAVHLNSASDIKQYLDKVWYQGHSDAYWHNLHKNKKVNNYFGYWSWEAAAIAKIKGIDDSSLKKQKYYPYDAVHW